MSHRLLKRPHHKISIKKKIIQKNKVQLKDLIDGTGPNMLLGISNVMQFIVNR